jgi:hypothetical protein
LSKEDIMKRGSLWSAVLLVLTLVLSPVARAAGQEIIKGEKVVIDWDYEISRLDRLMDHLSKLMENPESGTWLAPDVLNLLQQRVRFLRLFSPNLGRKEYEWPPMDTLTPNINRVPGPIPKL